MTATRRWCLVALGVLLLVAVPLVVRPAWPVRSSPLSAAALLAEVRSSASRPYSGYVESLGTLGLPLTDQFTDLADLFGERTRMRVWWRDDSDWRVDHLTPTGETDLYQGPVGTTSWDYESNRATRTGPAVVRLPQTSDLLPPQLAAQLLSGAGPGEVTRLGSARIAGISAAGLRLSPRDPRSSISRVEIWADPATGLPLKTTVYAAGATNPAVASWFDSVSLHRPAEADTTFVAAPGTRSRFEDVVDIAAAANAFAPVVAPPTLAGLARSGDSSGAVGVYGRGAVRLIAIPVRDRVAGPLRTQLLATPGTVDGPTGLALTVAPLNLLLTPADGRQRGWLLAGWVTPQTLAAAAEEIARTPPLDNGAASGS